MNGTAFRHDIWKQVVRIWTFPADKTDRGNAGSQQSVLEDWRLVVKGIQVGTISFGSTE